MPGTDPRPYLTDAKYPCGRDELLRAAAAAGAGDDVLGPLGTLPARDYADGDGVWEAIRSYNGAPIHDTAKEAP
ncbi:DUF2795 domain-containing protein [Amycolatopsis sp. WAC 04169]|uniref:DUF2795 domain-containing protein n=2 Tax=Amycolatopsis keratiniphila TaxID=129921 RepID=R4SWS9_9PSEU|nr:MULTISPECIES: DUF2795 domain-containing protein [Amycolatopsis]AGM06975.1 hypothetical protein AORI_4390 [Amycolatopsis keratiniphila]OLZ45877.1 hypothetical protein BS330_38230 [Amycolatopsis keratiniphila subsp. nogabecina]ONF73528.1 hypothetical protein AVR91_0205205 [Amycolatopsis keratiniphila subsp. keratiniphila]RSN20619.1 DUF2795 domain-containing protein [Amycolatopsis sp. WAC 04169]SDU13243.1 Protein of unknown function [Amycolatopsis keratiniphila]